MTWVRVKVKLHFERVWKKNLIGLLRVTIMADFNWPLTAIANKSHPRPHCHPSPVFSLTLTL